MSLKICAVSILKGGFSVCRKGARGAYSSFILKVYIESFDSVKKKMENKSAVSAPSSRVANSSLAMCKQLVYSSF